MKKYLFFAFQFMVLISAITAESRFITVDEFNDISVKNMLQFNYCTMDIVLYTKNDLPSECIMYSDDPIISTIAFKRGNKIITFTYTDFKPNIEGVKESKKSLEIKCFNTNVKSDYIAMMEFMAYLFEKYF